MGKATRAEINGRISVIEEKLLSGASYTVIVEYCRQEWGIRKAQASKYIKHATKRLQREADKTTELNYLKAIRRNETLREDAERDGDNRLILEIDKERNKLEGNYSPDKKSITDGNGTPISLVFVKGDD